MPRHVVSPKSFHSPYKVIFLLQRLNKPTTVYSSSATLIDNIFANKNCGKIASGNVISDISAHHSQFCLTEFSCETNFPKKTMIRDFCRFSEADFNSELAQVDWGSILAKTQVNTLVNKHARLKPLSKRKFKQSSKSWITKGLLKSIKIKNALYRQIQIPQKQNYNPNST